MAMEFERIWGEGGEGGEERTWSVRWEEVMGDEERMGRGLCPFGGRTWIGDGVREEGGTSSRRKSSASASVIGDSPVLLGLPTMSVLLPTTTQQ